MNGNLPNFSDSLSNIADQEDRPPRESWAKLGAVTGANMPHCHQAYRAVIRHAALPPGYVPIMHLSFFNNP
jgi:hypothetical protein